MKFALTACSGMSPSGLITRVKCSDIVENSDDVVSICMGVTAADNEDFIKLNQEVSHNCRKWM